jgi:rSAM/selenodomain-associated transferase 1
VKTRLGAVIGAENAARLYRAFLADLSERFERAQRQDGYALHWAYWPADRPMRDVLGPHARIFAQRGADFADRLANACWDLRSAGYRRAVILGSDSPQAPAATARRAFELLTSHDVVLGPADDGGYYLAGVHLLPAPPDLFRGIVMSTPAVLADTVRRAEHLRCSTAFLPPTFDVDERVDLDRLRELLRRDGPGVAPRTARALQLMALAQADPLPRQEAQHAPGMKDKRRDAR